MKHPDAGTNDIYTEYESIDGVAYVIYESKTGDRTETFTALDWLARLITHIPNRGEQLVRYYGYYSNKSRGMRKKAETDEQVPALIDSDISKKNISFIEDETVIKKILKHLNLWETRIHDPPTDMRIVCNGTTVISEFSNFTDDVFSLNTYADDYSRLTYEDDYSQLTSYEDD